MAEKPTIPDFPTLPDFSLMITQACEVVASVRGIPYDFNGTLSLENKFVVLFKTVKEMFEAQDELVKSYKALYDFVNTYFANINIQDAVNKKLDEMLADGTLENIIGFWLYGGYSLWVGDSYVQANSLGSEKNKRFSTLVSTYLRTTELNYAIGGTGFSTDNNFLSQLQTAYTENSGNADKIKYVFIAGGRNDAYLNPNYSYAQITNSVLPTFNYAKSKFPNAIIVAIPMMFDSTEMPRVYRQWKAGILNAINSFNCVKISDTSFLFRGDSSFILDDNVHPTAFGHAVLSSAICSALKGGNYLPFRQSELTDIQNFNNPLTFYQNGLICGCNAQFTTSSIISGKFYEKTQVGFLGYLGVLANIPVYNLTDKTISYIQYKCIHSNSTHNFTLTLATIGDLLPEKTYLINYSNWLYSPF